MADFIKVKATNTSNGPRIFNSAPPVTLQAGQSTDGEVNITEAELTSMQFYGQFEISGDPLDHDDDGKKGGSKSADPVALSGKNKAELLDIAKAEGVEIEDGATNDDIKAAIELAREEAAKK